jgi:hypothetical protein
MNAFKPRSPPSRGGAEGVRCGMPADYLVRIPTSMPRDGSWIEELYEELLARGILAEVIEKTTWPGRLDKSLVYDVLSWRCWRNGGSICPAVAFEGEKAYLVVLDEKAEKFVKVMDFEQVLIEEIKGLIRYSECLEKYGYDFPC